MEVKANPLSSQQSLRLLLQALQQSKSRPPLREAIPVVEVSSGAGVTVEDVEMVVVPIIIIKIKTTHRHNKILIIRTKTTYPSPTNVAPGIRMGPPTTRAAATGPWASPRLIVQTLWSVVGPSSLCLVKLNPQLREKLASLVQMKIQT